MIVRFCLRVLVLCFVLFGRFTWCVVLWATFIGLLYVILRGALAGLVV